VKMFTFSCKAMSMCLVFSYMYICEGPEQPANLNSDWIQHAIFLTLNFIMTLSQGNL